ncbi:hypothetical protein NPIL_354681 [Nephila pilipes]|uniref:Uncharacterized protein n=1 Tax=Nephila pilipes TaxID=299642 RepID=A0A8X6MCS6_NEPPI|nr:hypothetical protein NPIL_354681 [Nephila pilipes]
MATSIIRVGQRSQVHYQSSCMDEPISNGVEKKCEFIQKEKDMATALKLCATCLGKVRLRATRSRSWCKEKNFSKEHPEKMVTPTPNQQQAFSPTLHQRPIGK